MENQRQWEEEFLSKVYEKLFWATDEVSSLKPYTTKDGIYNAPPAGKYHWFCGFWGGIQWWLYKFSKDEKFLKKAKAISEDMDYGLTDFVQLDHDVGFQYLLTTVADYEITGSDRAMVSGIHAATLLAGRFNLAGRYIRAWNETKYLNPTESKTGYAIIDCMMNLPLLFWASEETGDPRFRQIAEAHADTALREFIREDGSSHHIVVFNPEDGSVVDFPAGQGYASGSSWTRGQGWAIYGFAMAYFYTKKKEYFETALKVAKNFLKRMPETGIPPVDFDQPEEPAEMDSSAGVIALCGMIDLKKWASEEDQQWLEEGICLLFKGAYANCDFTKDSQAVLQNGKELYHGGCQKVLIYGDFYLMEALMKRRGCDYLFHKQ
ncbi:MAG: glycoside hydrolase family 88 protein [Lachnospiraceae bacterium]|nr:glycoside hydrolase family 88 protein [Lachnospiraceae bacterium]MBP3594375.1 glycoside hydrolase family 88 protein [Lachnospiraceae bacterium]